ncbi:hypothetical protein B5X24_HaOG216382 [Helicoverpa armigera]|nr:hypothetical protein B5X24_HaOG216382 [Helicoverpa armigera]
MNTYRVDVFAILCDWARPSPPQCGAPGAGAPHGRARTRPPPRASAGPGRRRVRVLCGAVPAPPPARVGLTRQLRPATDAAIAHGSALFFVRILVTNVLELDARAVLWRFPRRRHTQLRYGTVNCGTFDIPRRCLVNCDAGTQLASYTLIRSRNCSYPRRHSTVMSPQQ